MKTNRNLIQLCLLAALLLPALTASATQRTVTSLNDSGAGTLRDTIAASVANDSIVFNVSGPIMLTSGELPIGRNLTITGPGATNLTVSGNGSNRVFNITAGTVNISGLTIFAGHAVGTNGISFGSAGSAVGGDGLGGGILNNGTLALVNCYLAGNTARGGDGAPHGTDQGGSGGAGSGAGIFNYGTLALTGCTFYKNTGTGGTGGSETSFGVVSGDGGQSHGAGIANDGTAALTNCTFYGNESEGGKAGEAQIIEAHNVTGNGGLAEGGAIWSGGTSVTMVNCTISRNSASGGNADDSVSSVSHGGNGVGGGLAVDFGGLTLRNTIVAGNGVGSGYGHLDLPQYQGTVSGPDVAGNAGSQGHNLIGQTDGSSGWVGSDLTGTSAALLNAQLGPVQINGGSTPTMALLAASPAIDAGDDAVLSAPYNLTTDQRGMHRPGGFHVDIGAYEFVGNTLLVTTLTDSGGGSLRSAISSASDGDRIIFTPLVTGTIGLTSGELLINNQLNIIGPGATNLTISGDQSSRVFHVNASGILNLFGVTLANGLVAGANGASGAIGGDAIGGGLFDEGSASLTDCVITNDSATGGTGGTGVGGQGANGGNGAGGGIYNSSLLSLLRCTLSGNSAQGGMGGTGASGSSGATGGTGGAAFGAGLANAGSTTLINCTLAGNIANAGQGGTGGHGNLRGQGGIGGLGGTAHAAGLSPDSGSATLTSCTISSNLSAAGSAGFGGIGGNLKAGTLGPGSANSGGLFSAGNVQVQNTIIAGNQATTLYADVSGTVQSGGFNLVGISDGSSGWLVGEIGNLGNSSFPINPKLGPLQNNGGPTPTMALLIGSPAIDQGNSFGLTTDQRGFARPSDNGAIANASGGDGSDIGAYEVTVLVATPAILSLVGYGNNHFQFLLTGQAGSSYAIQASTNLTTTNWLSIFTNVSPFTFVDSNANSFPQRFYRGVSSP
jgi:hypothetical protein